MDIEKSGEGEIRLIKGSLWNKELDLLFRSRFKCDIRDCRVLTSHGSDRIILRLISGDKTAIGIINKDAKENRTFIEFSKHFKTFGLRVPEIYGVSDDLLCYVLEDLGDLTLALMMKNGSENGTFKEDFVNVYKRAISQLIRFQIEAGASVDYSLCNQFNRFGEENINFDINYFKENFLKNYYPDDGDRIEADLEFLKKKLLERKGDYFLYRDFQSRNIMIKQDELYFIDYQSGRKGALQYDLASLLFDSRANIPNHIKNSLIEYYINELKKFDGPDEEEFKYYFSYFAVIRILQALGAYGFLGHIKKKRSFLESIPPAVRNMKYVLEEKIDKNELKNLRKVFIKSEIVSPLFERRGMTAEENNANPFEKGDDL